MKIPCIFFDAGDFFMLLTLGHQLAQARCRAFGSRFFCEPLRFQAAKKSSNNASIPLPGDGVSI